MGSSATMLNPRRCIKSATGSSKIDAPALISVLDIDIAPSSFIFVDMLKKT